MLNIRRKNAWDGLVIRPEAFYVSGLDACSARRLRNYLSMMQCHSRSLEAVRSETGK